VSPLRSALILSRLLPDIRAAIIVSIAIAIMCAVQLAYVPYTQLTDAVSCASGIWPYVPDSCDPAVEKNQTSVSLERPERSTSSTAPDPVESSIGAANQAAETELQTPTTVEDSTIPPTDRHAARLQQSASSKLSAVSRKARAEVHFQDRHRSAAHRPARRLGLGLAPREKSFTGAGASFDAVH
jgi:hypothetical protein